MTSTYCADEKNSSSVAADPVEQLYRLGACALENQDFQEAVRLFENLTHINDNPVFRAELGRAYLGALQFERAHEQFLSALASNPPDSARQLLQIYLQMSEQRHTQVSEWYLSASLGYQYDSNVNSGPKHAEITLYGLPFVMNPANMPKSDRALHGVFSVSRTSIVGKNISWQSSGVVDVLRHDTMEKYDVNQIYLDTGPHISLGSGNLDLYLPISLTQTTLANKGFSTSWLFTQKLTQQASESDRITYSTALGHKHYVNVPERDASSRQANIAWEHTFPNKWAVEPSLHLRTENASGDIFDNISRSATIAVYGNMAFGLRASADASLEWVYYKGAEDWAYAPRRDKQSSYSLSLSRNIGSGYYLSLNVTSVDISSNLDLYSSNRVQTQLQLTKSF